MLRILVTPSAFGFLGLCFAWFAGLAAAQSTVLLDTMTEELNRNFSTLKSKSDPAPYFLSYEVTEENYQGVAATLGAVTGNSHGKSRRLDVCVRVGSPQLDNYHRLRGERAQFTSGAALTYEDKPDALKMSFAMNSDTDACFSLST